jgi:ubiquinone/menaquinone biosynthesis C-methylase UbiE
MPERMPGFGFRMMTWTFYLTDLFRKPNKILDEFGIKKGFTVIDYGCGPGRYIKKAYRLVGERGKVYAVDIHELAVEAVRKLAKKENLTNVVPVLADGYSCSIESDSADLIYAMDMFHQIRQPEPFLLELRRIVRPNGVLIIDNGHRSREKARIKIENSGAWRIAEENRRFLKCRPLNK